MRRLSFNLSRLPYCFVLITGIALIFSGCAQTSQVHSYEEQGKPDVYIWPNSNSHSNNEATLTLLVKAGSLQEADDERGYAHFLEHMVFRGSDAFPGEAMKQQMDELGLDIGRHSNAYTTFDHTAYWINLNSVEPERLEAALELLSQWAFHAEISPAMVDQERPVIIEEWRLSEPDEQRAQQTVRADYFGGSRHGERLPIGTRDSIESATAEGLRAFYERWYQPDNMAVIVTGDVDEAATRALVDQYFPPQSGAEGAVPVQYDLNPGAMADRLIITDPFITDGYLELRYFVEEQTPQSKPDWLDYIAMQAALDILEDRLDNRTLTTQGAVTGFNVSWEYASPNVLFLGLGAGLSRDDFAQAINLLEGERQRLLTDGILERELNDWRRGVLEYERSQQDSAAHLSNEVVDHVMYGWPLMGQGEYLQWLEAELPALKPQDLVDALSRRMNAPARVVAVHPHQRPAPTEQQLNTWLAEAAYEPSHEDEAEETEALGWPIEPTYQGTVIAEQPLENGITQWELSNGMEVLYTYSDATPGRVSFHMVGDGGFNVMDETDSLTGRLAAETLAASGLRELTGAELQQWLQANAVEFNLEVDFFDRALHGSAPSSEFSVAMNLIHIALTEAKVDPEVLAHQRAQNESLLEQFAVHPYRPWIEQVNEVLFLQDPAFRTMTLDELHAVDAAAMAAVYDRYFAGAQNYRLAIVGDISRQTVQQGVMQAIATLPPTENMVEVNRHYPAPIASAARFVEGSGEREASLRLSYSREKTDLEGQSSADIAYFERWLNHYLHQDIREKQGLTYSIQAYVDGETRFHDEYTLVIHLSTDPGRVVEVLAAVDVSLQEALGQGPDSDKLATWQRSLAQDERQTLNDPGTVAYLQAYASLFNWSVGSTLNTDVRDADADLLRYMLGSFMSEDAVNLDLVWLP